MAEENSKKLNERISGIFNEVISICIAGFLIWFVADWTSNKDKDILALQNEVKVLKSVVESNQARNDDLIKDSIESAIGVLSEELYEAHDHGPMEPMEPESTAASIPDPAPKPLPPPRVDDDRRQYEDALKHRVNSAQQQIQRRMPSQGF
jgi:hypothetical protein